MADNISNHTTDNNGTSEDDLPYRCIQKMIQLNIKECWVKLKRCPLIEKKIDEIKKRDRLHNLHSSISKEKFRKTEKEKMRNEKKITITSVNNHKQINENRTDGTITKKKDTRKRPAEKPCCSDNNDNTVKNKRRKENLSAKSVASNENDEIKKEATKKTSEGICTNNLENGENKY